MTLKYLALPELIDNSRKRAVVRQTLYRMGEWRFLSLYVYSALLIFCTEKTTFTEVTEKRLFFL